MATHTSKYYIIEIKHSFTKCEKIFNTQHTRPPDGVKNHTKYIYNTFNLYTILCHLNLLR